MIKVKDDETRKAIASFLWISAVAVLGGCFLLAVRFALTKRAYYFFLVWNLLLALVPYGIAVAMYALSRGEGKRGRTLALPLGVCWLVFYPNAPYLFTDFIHLVNRTWLRVGSGGIDKDTLLWYDLVLCSAFAFMGHQAGLVSIELVLKSLQKTVSRVAARLFVAAAVLVAGFGLFIGRFVRFNSWDLFVHPIQTGSKIITYLESPRTFLLTAAFSAFIFITYVVQHRAAGAAVQRGE